MSENKKNEGNEDPELDDLLDSALQDFDKLPSEKKVSENVSNSASAEIKNDSNADNLWNNEFISEAQKHFEDNMKVLFEQGASGSDSFSPDKFEEHLKKLADETTKVLSEHSTNPNFSSTIADTLKKLSENSESLQSEKLDDITSLLGGLNMEGGADIFPFMQNMMQSFLSKDLLYPCIKEITEKYPGWLEENKSNLSDNDYNNFNKQLQIMEKVCSEFEQETSSDNDETKKRRFTKILSLMEEMQSLGQPPKDLLGADNPFADGGMPNIPGMDPSECSIM